MEIIKKSFLRVTIALVIISLISTLGVEVISAAEIKSSAPDINFYNFDGLLDVPSTITATDATLSINDRSDYSESGTGDSLKAVLSSSSVIKMSAPGGVSWKGEYISLWFKTISTRKATFEISFVTSDNVTFKKSEPTVFDAKNGMRDIIRYDEFKNTSGAAMTALDTEKISYVLFTATSDVKRNTTLYIDNIKIKTLPDESGEEPAIAEVDTKSAQLSVSDYLKLTADESQIVITLKDEALYSLDNADTSVELPIDNLKDAVKKRDSAYLVFDVKVPRITGFVFSMLSADGSQSYSANIGAMPNVTDSEGFVTAKIPLTSFAIGMSAAYQNILTRLQLSVDPQYLSTYNFLNKDESVVFKNIRIIEGDPGENAYTFKQIKPLSEAPLSPDELAAEESMKIVDINDFSQTVYSNTFDQWNAPTYGASAVMDYGTISKTNSYYKSFGKYATFTVLNQDVFYLGQVKPGDKAEFFGMHVFPDTELTERTMNEQYLDTATVTFWAAASKDMEIYVNYVDRVNFTQIRYPISLSATSDGEFKQYSFKLKELYDWTLANEPEKLYTVSLRSLMEICFLPVKADAEHYLANDESFSIAGVYVWTKDAKEINRLEKFGEVFGASDSENGVFADSYRGALKKESTMRVTNLNSDISEYSPIFGKAAEIKELKSVYFYSEEGKRITPSGKIWIKFRAPSGVAPEDVSLYRVFFDGSAEFLRTVVEGDSITAYTYDDGIFALVTGEVGAGGYDLGGSDDSSYLESDNDVISPETGDSYGTVNMVVLIAIISLAVCGRCLFALIKNRGEA